MGFIYEETNHYGVEAIVALERYCTPSDEKTCTAATEATRICETYGIPERELLPLVRALLNTGDYALIAVEVTCDHDHTTRTETPAACTQDGSVTVTCDDCGAVLSTEAIPATGHDYKDGKCTVCGAADPDYRPEQPEDPGQPEKPEQPENPGVKTGDSDVLLYMGLMLLALTGSAWVLRKKRAR